MRDRLLIRKLVRCWPGGSTRRSAVEPGEGYGWLCGGVEGDLVAQGVKLAVHASNDARQHEIANTLSKPAQLERQPSAKASTGRPRGKRSHAARKNKRAS